MARKTSSSLSDLLARCALSDQKAFVDLYHATSPKLFGIAIRILHEERWAEEALQESYMKIWHNAGTYRQDKGTAMTWMINVTRNQALDFRRRSEYRSENGGVIGEDDFGISTEDPAAATQTSEQLSRLYECLNQLTEQQRHCILLIYHQGFTPTEVAKRQGLPIGTVKTWIRRGLIQIRECLRR